MERKIKNWMVDNNYGNWVKQTEVIEMMHKYAKEMSLEAWHEGVAEMEARKKMPNEPFLEFDEWWYQLTN